MPLLVQGFIQFDTGFLLIATDTSRSGSGLMTNCRFSNSTARNVRSCLHRSPARKGNLEWSLIRETARKCEECFVVTGN